MNRQVFHKWLIVIMAFLVLFGNIGVGMMVHHCMMKGTSVSWVPLPISSESAVGCTMHHVSPSKVSYDKPAFQAMPCCSDSSFYDKVDVMSVLHITLFKVCQNFSYQWVPEAFYAWVALTRIDWEIQYWIPDPIDLLPPLIGRSILALVQSYLI